ncbi:MAG: hypothetical protein C0456_06275 [Hyphomonas sp.]|uniref:hypothetical protein n=1 Tax=Hyphomonas sp. TaxID=87 RepID=UPI001DB00937|nr:hypothetical protein [Hyphomonas sp.]MBA4226222.1 hypothetical protein [Hyphomonas sp.]
MLVFTIALLLVSLVAFLVIGSLQANTIKTREDMYSASSGLDRFQVARTVLAANVSIAGGMQWFLVQGSDVGLQIILWGPIAVLIGMYLNAIFVERYAPENVFTGYSSFTTMVRDLFEGRAATAVLLIITSLGSLTILLIEIYVGVQVLKVFFPQIDVAGIGVLGFVVAAVTLYAVMGGLLGIVRNDWIQNAIIASVGIVVVIVIIGGSTSPYHEVRPAPAHEYTPMGIDLITWLVIVNLFFIPTQLRFWQVAGSAVSRSDFVRGYKRAAVQTALFWSLLAVAGYALLHYTGNSFETLDGLLSDLKNGPQHIAISVMFAIISLAAFAALVSSADSAIISLAQAASDVLVPASNNVLLQRAIVAAVGLLSFVIYVAVFLVLGTQFFAVFSSAFSLFILIAPMVGIALVDRATAKSKLYQYVSLGGLVVSLIVVLLSTYTALPYLPNSLWAGAIGFAICLVAAVSAALIARRHRG